jgi:hypothetical protein
MGVTIHFEGRLKTSADFDKVITLGQEFAKRKSADIIKLDSKKKLLQRVKDEKDWDYEGEVRGIQFQPHENSDPIVLEFDTDLYIQEYCKTQFADISTHIEVIQFLRDIEPHFDNLTVVDEGEFWETSDIKVLEQKFENFFYAFEKAIEENPKLKGPFKIKGRIIDLME